MIEPLQNRVTPFNELVADRSYVGTFMGNRGVLHNDHRQIVRHWRSEKRWIICLTKFKGRQRELMFPGLYTELFFLDEPTALAAGHRPCAECRRDAFNQYVAAVSDGPKPLGATAVDALLDPERRDGDAQRTHRADAASLPDGTMIALDGDAWLVWHGALHRWQRTGYGDTRAVPAGEVDVLTPPTSVRALRNGFVPVVHGSMGTI